MRTGTQMASAAVEVVSCLTREPQYSIKLLVSIKGFLMLSNGYIVTREKEQQLNVTYITLALITNQKNLWFQLMLHFQNWRKQYSSVIHRHLHIPWGCQRDGSGVKSALAEDLFSSHHPHLVALRDLTSSLDLVSTCTPPCRCPHAHAVKKEDM